MTSIPMTTEYVDVKVKIGAVEFTNEELQIDSMKADIESKENSSDDRTETDDESEDKDYGEESNSES